MKNDNKRIGFIGAGMVGKSLAVALTNCGYNVVAVASRTYASAENLAGLFDGCVAFRGPQAVVDACDFVLITSTDDSIESVASSVVWREGQGVAHCSGVASLEILSSSVGDGALVGAMHPLQAFSSVDYTETALRGTTFAIEGNGEMRAYLKKIVLDLGGNPIFLRSGDKPLYHATVVMMGGILAGMFGHVADLWAHFGINRDDALNAITPIAQSVITSVNLAGIPQAIAGPYARGDIGTIKKHIDALRSTAPESMEVYCRMALAGLPYALEKGKISERQAAEIKMVLSNVFESTDQKR